MSPAVSVRLLLVRQWRVGDASRSATPGGCEHHFSRGAPARGRVHTRCDLSLERQAVLVPSTAWHIVMFHNSAVVKRLSSLGVCVAGGT
jgi:hypothetical protein